LTVLPCVSAGVAAGAVLALAAAPALTQGKTVKIGLISTFGGPVATIGNDMRNSFELGLDHLGRKLGGLPVEVIYEDDQQRPDVGVQKTQKLIESDKVNFVAGYIWSNVLLASLKPVVDAQTFLVSANAGPSQIAGELCSPYFFSTSWQNDQTPMAMGEYMNQKGVKSVFLIGPNYAAGKDMLTGVRATFKGRVVAEELIRRYRVKCQQEDIKYDRHERDHAIAQAARMVSEVWGRRLSPKTLRNWLNRSKRARTPKRQFKS
jgi:branched-chain amino acid transport system substrate-binding protein